jgi:hypothetical protein
MGQTKKVKTNGENKMGKINKVDDVDEYIIVFLGKSVEFGDKDKYQTLGITKNELICAKGNIENDDFENVFCVMFNHFPEE